jgi:hypothetical protein
MGAMGCGPMFGVGDSGVGFGGAQARIDALAIMEISTIWKFPSAESSVHIKYSVLDLRH